jgi:hypothetical protein
VCWQRGSNWGGFSASGGVATKLRLLQIEGALAARQQSLFGLDSDYVDLADTFNR